MASAWSRIAIGGVGAPLALSCVMHQVIAADGPKDLGRSVAERARLSVSARSQMMTFARALWLRERGTPGGDAPLWRLWESDWTAIRRTAVAQLPGWCRDMTAEAGRAESRGFAITFLHGHSMPDSLNVGPDSSPSPGLWVAVRSVAGSSMPPMASPSLAIQRSLDELPAVTATAQTSSRLATTVVLDDRSVAGSLEAAWGIDARLLD